MAPATLGDCGVIYHNRDYKWNNNMKIDDKLKDIKPYLLTIRYQDNLSIVDVQLKDGWKVPSSKIFGIKPYGGEYPNTYMFYSDNEEVGIDDILSFIEDIVKVNIEREKKMALLAEKTVELREFFINHSFEELKKLKFSIDNGFQQMPIDDFTPSTLETINVVNEEGMSETNLPEAYQEEIISDDDIPVAQDITKEEMIKEESN
jgi:hypothetical protein